MKPRCEILFEHSIKSDHTRDSYLRCMKKFMRFVGVENFEQLLQSDQKAIQEKVEDYVIHLKGRISPNSFNPQLAPIFLFYALNDIVLNKTKLKKMFPSRVKTSGFNAYTKHDIVNMLSNTRKIRSKAIILIFSSTGCRVGGLTGLKIKDILDVPNSECKCLRFDAGSPEEYFGFLTPESVKTLNEYLQERVDHGEKLTEDKPLIALTEEDGNFAPSEVKPITRSAISNIITTILRNQKRTREGNRFAIPTTHGFRKYFNKTLKMRDGCNLSVCERLLGHSLIKLDSHYLPLGRDDLFKEFSKAIPDVTIREDERQLLRIMELEKQSQTHEDKAKENKVQKDEIEILKLKIERMENTIDV